MAEPSGSDVHVDSTGGGGRKPKRLLRRMTTNRVDLVDAGANQHAHVAMLKAKAHPFVDKNDDGKCDICGGAKGDPQHDMSTTTKSEGGNMAVDELVNEIATELPDTVDEEAKKSFIAKLKEKLSKNVEKHEEEKPAPEAKPEATTETKPEGEGGTVTEKKEDIFKGLTPEVRKYLEDQEKVAKDAMAKAEAAEKRANEEYEKRLEREYLEKAAAFKALPGTDRAKLAKGLRAIDAIEDEETKKALMDTLISSERVIKSARLFETVGSAKGADGSDPEAKLDEMAKSLVQKGDFKSQAEAYDHVIQTEEGRALYAQYTDNKEGVR